MARRKARIPQGKKIQPAVKTLQFTVPAGDHYIDISQCASLVNRRFYRQGLNWAVAGFSFFTSAAASGKIGIAKVPDTWVASNAWMKGFAAWQAMNRDALSESESVKPKFLDFKVFMDPTHHSNGVSNNLIPLDTAGNPYSEGEWEYSKYHIPNTAVDSSDPTSNNPREIVWTGANYQGAGASGDFAVSLIEGYAASRGLPDIEDPNAPQDALSVNASQAQNWLAALDNDFDQQAGEVLSDMISENNQAPYPYEGDGTATDTQYPGGANQAPGPQSHMVALVSPTTIGGRTNIEGGNFQGGLVKITNNTGDSEMTLFLHLVPGPHRGYMCQAMQDV